MADFGAIFSLVTRGSALSLDLYRLAATTPDGRFLCQIAKSISNFSLTVKQLGTIISQDDTLPSAAAIQVLDDVLDQCSLVLEEISEITRGYASKNVDGGKQHDQSHGKEHRFTDHESARLSYLFAHLEALKCTIRTMLQTLFTAQSMIWARVRPTISPKQAEAPVTNEKTQLESLVIEQQIAILSAAKLYDTSRPDARLLTEEDSSQSLIVQETNSPNPVELFRYQDRFITSLNAVDTTEEDWITSICSISKSHSERLLSKWTRLRQLHDRISDNERQQEAERRETQQPTVESESDDEAGSVPKNNKSNSNLAIPVPCRPGSTQPLLTENTSLPIPVPNSKYGPAAPLSPASSCDFSPRSSIGALSVDQNTYSPVSPRSSISSLPVEAAAAVEAKYKDEDIALEIPWQLILNQYYWSYIDDKLQETRSELPKPNDIVEGKYRTQLSSSWVCKDAIQEAEYKYTQVQNPRRDGRRTKMETCFLIEQKLTFEQVQHLVERTVEIFRQTQPPSPPPRRSSSNTKSTFKPISDRDQDRTPLASQLPTAPNRYPPLERSRTSYPYPPPPPLDRSSSLPGPPAKYPPQPALSASNPNATTLHLPLRPPQHPQQGIFYPPQNIAYPPPPPFPPQQPPYNPSAIPPNPHIRIPLQPQQPPIATPQYAQHSPLRQSQPHAFAHTHIPPQPVAQQYRTDYYSSTPTTSASDSDNVPKVKGSRGDRTHRSRSRRPSSHGHHSSGGSSIKKKHIGTLATVGGLTALLDMITDVGVL